MGNLFHGSDLLSLNSPIRDSSRFGVDQVLEILGRAGITTTWSCASVGLRALASLFRCREFAPSILFVLSSLALAGMTVTGRLDTGPGWSDLDFNLSP